MMTPISYCLHSIHPLYTQLHTHMLFSRFCTLLCALVTVNTAYTFYFFLFHHCTNSLSSLHIFLRHCTFCASHFVHHILCITFCASHFVHHCTLKQALANNRESSTLFERRAGPKNQELTTIRRTKCSAGSKVRNRPTEIGQVRWGTSSYRSPDKC